MVDHTHIYTNLFDQRLQKHFFKLPLLWVILGYNLFNRYVIDKLVNGNSDLIATIINDNANSVSQAIRGVIKDSVSMQITESKYWQKS